MNYKSIKSGLISALLVVSCSCFVYVNIASVADTDLKVAAKMEEKAPIDEASNPFKLLDLTFVKGLIAVVQKFMPAL